MNADPHHLESLLRSLPPAAASPELYARVEEELRLDMSWLASPAPRRRSVRWLAPVTYLALGAAAAMAVMSTLSLSPTPDLPAGTSMASSIATSEGVLPISTINEWDEVQDQGIQYGADRTPQKLVRMLGTERRIYIDPRDGAEVIVEVPREQSMVLPVSFQ
jgi:hypothetical protein